MSGNLLSIAMELMARGYRWSLPAPLIERWCSISLSVKKSLEVFKSFETFIASSLVTNNAAITAIEELEFEDVAIAVNKR